MSTAILSCSERQDSLTLKCSQLISQYFTDAQIIDLKKESIAIFPNASPESLSKTKDIIRQSSQIIIVSPEYNWSISPTAKNLLDYLGADAKLWDNKVFMCHGVSVGRGGRLPIIELWQIINKLIFFTKSCSVLSPYNLEFNQLSFNEDGTANSGFLNICEEVFSNHKKLAERFLS